MTEKLFFFIADISGYTSFMVSTKTALNHAMVIITQLMESVIAQVKLPMKISKLEGDAVFLYMTEASLPKEMRENPLVIGQRLIKLFNAFSLKLQELAESNFCECEACANLSGLKLKLIGHYGEAIISKIGSFEELTGLDVIITHRLLKNTVEQKQYILLTEEAYDRVLLPDRGTSSKREEEIGEVGKIALYLYEPVIEPKEKEFGKSRFRLKNMFPKEMSSFFLGLKGKGKNTFKNL